MEAVPPLTALPPSLLGPSPGCHWACGVGLVGLDGSRGLRGAEKLQRLLVEVGGREGQGEAAPSEQDERDSRDERHRRGVDASQSSEPAQSLLSGSGHAAGPHQSVLLLGVPPDGQNDDPLGQNPVGQQRWRQQR